MSGIDCARITHNHTTLDGIIVEKEEKEKKKKKKPLSIDMPNNKY